MQSEKFTAGNISIKYLKNDTDVHIIEIALVQFNRTNTIKVIGEDVDLLILLTARAQMEKIFKIWKAQVQTKIYSSQ